MSRKKKRTVNQAEIKRMKKLQQEGCSLEAIAGILDRDLRTVRKYLGINDMEQLELRKIHRIRLSERSQKIMEYLQTYFPYIDDIKIVDGLMWEYDEEEKTENISLLTDFLSTCLLTHLKNEFPQLSELGSWDDLLVHSIRDWDLVNILGKKAEQGTFKDKCEICKDWD